MNTRTLEPFVVTDAVINTNNKATVQTKPLVLLSEQKTLPLESNKKLLGTCGWCCRGVGGTWGLVGPVAWLNLEGWTNWTRISAVIFHTLIYIFSAWQGAKVRDMFSDVADRFVSDFCNKAFSMGNKDVKRCRWFREMCKTQALVYQYKYSQQRGDQCITHSIFKKLKNFKNIFHAQLLLASVVVI